MAGKGVASGGVAQQPLVDVGQGDRRKGVLVTGRRRFTVRQALIDNDGQARGDVVGLCPLPLVLRADGQGQAARIRFSPDTTHEAAEPAAPRQRPFFGGPQSRVRWVQRQSPPMTASCDTSTPDHLDGLMQGARCAGGPEAPGTHDAPRPRTECRSVPAGTRDVLEEVAALASASVRRPRGRAERSRLTATRLYGEHAATRPEGEYR
ncbi:predicted protein [Streptomyces sp. C]|nr:predicted protein [Streptomyces sp. C]